ncbi:glycosyltransferase [Paenibacillus sp. 32352]|uniref:glycosyltransferase n=1 Tax=Paenibacillus sp. 32352 TaxID=1969111 RepID=UPI0009AD9C06|nr:glycosyltransferase [Paenibacillus sp. 32352]
MEENRNSHQAIKEALQQQDYRLAERLAKAQLEEDPWDAQVWASLGEALLHRGYGEAARKVFDRAWLLDPEAGWMQSVRSELSKREAGAERYDIELLLLTKPVRLSAAVIARNEQETIEKCIRSVSNVVDEIIVIDYGSTDRTVDIVRKLPRVKLVQADWHGSYARVRNEAHAHATGDWIVWLEANEMLHPDDARPIRDAACLFSRINMPVALDLVLLQRKNGALLQTFARSRMYPLGRGLSFEGKVYEVLKLGATDDTQLPLLRRKIRVRLQSISSPGHEGEKAGIRLELLQGMLQEQPDDPVWLLRCGQELAVQSRWEEALYYAKEADRIGKTLNDFPERLELAALEVRLLVELKRWEEAERAAMIALVSFPDYPDFSYYLSQIHMRMAEERYREAERSLNLAMQGFATYRGPDPADHDIADWRRRYMMAELALDRGELAVADDEYRKLLKVFPEWEELKRRREAIQLEKDALENMEPRGTRNG